MRSVETEGATIDEAIAKALELLHIERDRVDVEILENSTRGLLGFGGTNARVRATVRAVSQETATPAASLGPALEAAEMVLEEILAQLGVESPVEASTAEDGSHWFSIAGEGAGIVIGRHGQTLDAIDYLLNRVASHRAGGLVRIVLDVEGYRERRQEALEDEARRAAAEVRQSGRPVTLEPMSPRDRRIVHVALTDEKGVTTHSQGEGSFRRVVISPAESSGRSQS
jgi:spoIIIJ-associated protein